MELALIIKQKRKEAGLTQAELAHIAGIGLRFVVEAENGKKTLRMDKVNELLAVFGMELSPKIISNNETPNANQNT